MTIHPDAIEALMNGDHGAPFDLLGPHPIDGQTISIRAFHPNAREIAILSSNGSKTAMKRLHDGGFFELTLQAKWPSYAYELVITKLNGDVTIVKDTYAFPPILTDYDLYLLREGKHYESYEKLGAHVCEINGVRGVHFAVWAPNAYCVSVVGDFNNWDTRQHLMRLREDSGIWELFIPHLQEGQRYKYHIRSRFGGYRAEKADPYGFQSEKRPHTASIIANLDTYQWSDIAWMASRESKELLNQPYSIYEVHLGSWRRDENGNWLSYRELAHLLVDYAKDMGYTHLELMPIAEHPLDASWGYQVTGYFAPTSRYGSPQDFMYFVDYCHQNNIGVILDWVPAHFPKDGHALSYFDGTHLYEHADPRLGEHPDWGTYIFNYGRNEVKNFLIANALFWLKKYHIDGLRVDAVSSMLYLDFGRRGGEWLPNRYGGNENLEAIAFLREFNEVVHTQCPGAFTIAEESTAWPMVSRPTYLGGLGFTFKWNMGWMHDTLDYMRQDPIYRRWAHNRITFSTMYAFSENFVLSLSHDEVVHGKGSLINKMAGDWWQKFASLRLLFGLQYTHPGKILNFMGAEIGQWQEWSETRALDWHLLAYPTHKTLQAWIRDMNEFYRTQKSLYECDFDPRGFRWIEANDAEQSVYSFLRFAKNPDDFLVIALNCTPVPRYDYRIGVPAEGFYEELMNSDSAHYGGSNLGNYGGVTSEALKWHSFDHSIRLTLPPLAIIILKQKI